MPSFFQVLNLHVQVGALPTTSDVHSRRLIISGRRSRLPM